MPLEDPNDPDERLALAERALAGAEAADAAARTADSRRERVAAALALAAAYAGAYRDEDLCALAERTSASLGGAAERIDFHVALAEKLREAYCGDAEHAELQRALAIVRALPPAERLRWAGLPLLLAASLAREDRARALREPAEWLAAAPTGVTVPALADIARCTSRLAILLAGEDPMEAEREARRALELARASGEREARREALGALGEILFRRDALLEAEALLEVEAEDDERTYALREHIARRLGRSIPPRAVSEEAVARSEACVPHAPERGLVRFFEKPADPMGAVRAGRLATEDAIRGWSHGRMTTPDDLECERIFGPERAFCCACGRYQGAAYAGIVCGRCGVESITSRSRAVRSAHIELRAPVLHPWYRDLAALLLDADPASMAESGEPLYESLEALHPPIELRYASGPIGALRRAALELFPEQGPARPHHLVLRVIPVPPPEADPRVLPAARDPAVRAAYAALVASAPEGEPAAVAALFRAIEAAR